MSNKKVLKAFFSGFSIILFITISGPLFSDAEWKFLKEKSGIKLYSGDHENSGIKIFKGTGIIDCSIKVIYQVLKHPPAYEEFLHNCIESRLIKKFNEFDQIALNVTNMPWPVKDREMLVRSSVAFDYQKGIFTLSLKGLPVEEYKNYLPVTPGRAPMKSVLSVFILEVIGREKTRVTYMIHADPGGIPPGLVNLSSANYPYHTLIGLRKIVQKEEYVDAAALDRSFPELERLLDRL